VVLYYGNSSIFTRQLWYGVEPAAGVMRNSLD